MHRPELVASFWLASRFHISCIDSELTMRQYTKVLLATLTASQILVTPGSVTAAPLEDASAAFRNGDYATALDLLRPLASHGTAEAQYELGFLYYNGRGVPQDYAEAAKWYRLAAVQDLAEAQHDLGVMYLKGQGAPQD